MWAENIYSFLDVLRSLASNANIQHYAFSIHHIDYNLLPGKRDSNWERVEKEEWCIIGNRLWTFSILGVSIFIFFSAQLMVYISHCLLNLVHCGTHKSFIVDLKEMIFWIATKQGRLFERGKTKRKCETILWREIKQYRPQSHCSKDNSR